MYLISGTSFIKNTYHYRKLQEMELNEWKERGSYFTYKSHRIFTIDEGEGEVILLIHGFPTSSWDWVKVWSDLIKKYRVLAFDMIGFGFSAKPPDHDYTIFDQADLVESWLRVKGIRTFHMLSHDYGDTVAQELLARYNERAQYEFDLKSICLLNGGLFPETHRPLLIQKILMSPFGSMVSRFFTRKKLGQNFKKIFGPSTQPSEKELDNFWWLISNNNGKKVFHLLIRYMRERAQNRSRWVGALQETDVPIRLINGSLDPISGKHMVERYAELIAHPDIIELPEIGHYPNVEAPEEVVKHYFEFMEEIT